VSHSWLSTAFLGNFSYMLIDQDVSDPESHEKISELNYSRHANL
jgi:hypothetical protein